MKVLAIIGSPRRSGNTFRAVDKVREHLQRYCQDLEFEAVFMRDMQIGMCAGCFACISDGEEKCPLQDDVRMLKAKMMEADGIILASPCYAMGITGAMKNFIDRLAYTLHRPCFFDKAFLSLVTVGGVMGLKQALSQLAILSAGAKSSIRLGISNPPIPMAGFDARANKKIKKSAEAFFGAMQKRVRKLPGLSDLAYFYAFKVFTRFESYQKACPADHAYYINRKDYFYPLKGSPVRRLIGRALGAVMNAGFRLIIKKA